MQLHVILKIEWKAKNYKNQKLKHNQTSSLTLMNKHSTESIFKVFSFTEGFQYLFYTINRRRHPVL